jgi:hypothetical protein
MNLLVELNNFHEEVLYGEYLNQNSDTYILTKKINYDTGLFYNVSLKFKYELIQHNSFINVLGQIINIIKTHKIQVVTFITCERKFDVTIFLFLKILNPKIVFNRFSHNIPINALKKPFVSFAILIANKNFVIDNRVKIPFLASKHIYKEVFYGKFKGILNTNFPPNFESISDSIYILIIGSISFKRRNYMSLITEIGKINNNKVKFVMLTNYKSDDVYKFYNIVNDSEFSERFIFFDYYLNYLEFCKVIEIAHASALLFDSTIPLINDYTYFKVSSAVKFSEEFNKLILVSKDFRLKLKCEHTYYSETFLSDAINLNF